MTALLKVFCDPIGLHSRAMVRIAEAIKRHKPGSVQIVNNQQDAELVVFYPIGFDWVDHFKQCLENSQSYVVVECCARTAGTDINNWDHWWRRADLVWSYLDLPKLSYESNPNDYYMGHLSCTGNFYHAPLGIDPVFQENHASGIVRRAIVTTGYVSHPCAEAIEEVWIAARLAGPLRVYHIGPFPEGINNLEDWRWKHVKVLGPNCSDDTVAWHYNIAKWVCSLRHTEGFELPAAEGLACGARPILFDQPDIKHWYGEHAEYVPDCHGPELIDHLSSLFQGYRNNQAQRAVMYRPVENFERTQVKERFNWESIVGGFWKRILANLYIDKSPPNEHDADRLAQLIERHEQEDVPYV